MTDTLKRLRRKADEDAALLAAARPDVVAAQAMTKQERLEIVHDADARKARRVVKVTAEDDAAAHSLPLLADRIARVLSPGAEKHALEAAVDRFVSAERVYLREELRPDNQRIGWMGGYATNHGYLPVLPASAPEHKVELAAAWNHLLRLVNEATRVGVTKRHAALPIQLQADIDETAEHTRSVQVATPNEEWN